jgi:hypothetical protein
MTRAELLDAASMKLAEVVILLTAAGEKRLAQDAEELAECVEFNAVPLKGKVPPSLTSH